MDEADFERLRAERDAEPDRFRDWDPRSQFQTQDDSTRRAPEIPPVLDANSTAHQLERRPTEEIEQLSTVSSSSGSVQYQGIRSHPTPRHADSFATDRDSVFGYSSSIHRSETNRLNSRHERHPIALDRIATHRSQHAGTVGSTRTRISRPGQDDQALPNFGGGKPYPPALPDKEEYVVEFDGHDDPLHAQNWSTKKKYAKVSIVGTCLEY